MPPDPSQAVDADSLVPPRPNLGPEPWPDDPEWSTIVGGWALGLALALVVVVLVVIGRRRWNKPRSRSVAADGLDTPAIEGPPTARQRLIAASELVRGGLIAAFGPAWASKTTEEIAEEPGLVGRLGPSLSEGLLSFLRLADRAKFAEAEPESTEDWEAWAGSFVSSLEAGTTSRINGK